MKNLKLEAFKVAQLPSRAELEIKGGISCQDAFDIMIDVVLDTGWDGYCGMTIQCDGGSIPGVCP